MIWDVNIFKILFADIRMIYLKAKPRENLLAEFRKQVNPGDNPQHFIDDLLTPYRVPTAILLMQTIAVPGMLKM